ncbi:macrolide 2'-phosphotransferase [Paenibacillus sp. YN15]|uniref:macrolide 2'-phosphotransferase n=1 Tax=Paenibacillus sp. YN15 TaxID=1742774 RepID=UPI000DCE8413|nr:macrolide 2'-phosphotransferase [Paenibacillus sp. YN15]RAU97938.1 hypothetical protein DQG13_18325 [Paenibacillus sp. YN15]
MTEKQRIIEDILQQARSRGIEIEPAAASLNESGLDFWAVFADTAAGGRWVLRQPRRPDVIESAAYERKVLELVSRHLPVEVPDWQVHEPELIAYPLLGGVPIATINPELKQYDWVINPQQLPEVFVQSLAETLAALHNIPEEEARQAGLRVWSPGGVRQRLQERMEEVKAAFGVSRALWERWRAWLEDDTFWPDHSALVHGDLHPGHILVNPDGKVTGLLDWTEAEYADPAADFVTYYMLFGDEGLADLLPRYERAGGRVWPRMAEHIRETTASYPILIAIFAMKSGLEEYRLMACGALGVDENGNELAGGE